MSYIDSIYEAFIRSGEVSTDSRRIVDGSIFFALSGDNFDGNRFALKALEAGAAMAVVDNPDSVGESSNVDELIEAGRIIVVSDSLDALQALARRHRRELGIPILAITGSNGKTTTKELVSRVLAKRFRVSMTEGNFNNHIGVPLTLLKIDRNVEFAVVEMGANHPQEIALLCSIAEPNYGLITNIGKAHLEGFGGVEGVRRGKGELADYLESSGGELFYLSDSEPLSMIATEHPKLKSIPYTASEWRLIDGRFVEAEHSGTIFRSNLTGGYNINNIAASEALGRYFEISSEDIASAVGSYIPQNNRSQRIETASNSVVCDAYNANPSSMSAAIEAFALLCSREGISSKRIMILGSMLELGEESKAEHDAIREMVLGLISESKLDGAYFVGGEWSFDECSKMLLFSCVEQLREQLTLHPLSKHTILVKGSHSIGLEGIFDLL